MIHSPKFRSCAIGMLLLASTSAASLAASKDAVRDANRKCENAWATCDTKCDDKRFWREVRDCKSSCDVRLTACYRRADQLGPLKPEAGESGTGAPVLSTDP